MKQLYPALLALAVTQVLSSVQADTLDPVTIEDTVTINPNASEPEYYNRSRGVSADGGDSLSRFLVFLRVA
jgi:hypothetical protein